MSATYELGLYGANAMMEQIIKGLRDQTTIEQIYDQDNVAEAQMNTQIDHMANFAAQNIVQFDKVNIIMEKMKDLQQLIQPGKQKPPQRKNVSQIRGSTSGQMVPVHMPEKTTVWKKKDIKTMPHLQIWWVALQKIAIVYDGVGL